MTRPLLGPQRRSRRALVVLRFHKVHDLIPCGMRGPDSSATTETFSPDVCLSSVIRRANELKSSAPSEVAQGKARPLSLDGKTLNYQTIDGPLFISLYYAMHGKGKADKTGRTRPGFRGRVWIDGTEGTFLGYGRVVLLERIREHGSITKAAKSMEMSYRRAWQMVDSMNRQASSPLVALSTGGRGGGGARLTAEGEEAIWAFWTFYEDLQQFLQDEEEKIGVITIHANVRRG